MTKQNKKTAGLLTIHRVHNFGSALQTLATIRLVESLGIQCQLIDYAYPASYHNLHAAGGENTSTAKRIIKMLAARLGVFDLIALLRLIVCGEYRSFTKSEKKFHQFLKALPSTEACDKETVSRMGDRFDIYLTGSDQTWNPRYLFQDYTFLLDFVCPGKRKISYSSSFGAKKIMPEFQDAYSYFLKDYDALSVRERSGFSLVKKLTGKDAVYCADPTLTMTADDWRKEADYSSCPREPYLLCYLLDYVFNPYPYVLELIDFVAKKLGLEVFVLTLRKNKQIENFGFTCHYDKGPREFLGLYDKASFVISTSFHGTAFSVNFHKNFIAVTNPNASVDDRVTDLLNTLHLNASGIKAYSDIPFEKIALQTDYTGADPVLNDIRNQSKAYLRDALEEKK